jgi:PAS domain S-box-containing protein
VNPSPTQHSPRGVPEPGDGILDALPIGVALIEAGRPGWMNLSMRRQTAADPHLVAVIEAAASDHRVERPRPVMRIETGRSCCFVSTIDRPGEAPLVLLTPAAFLGQFDAALADVTQLYEDFREIFRSSFDGIFVVDGTGRTLMVNEGCERNYDVTAAQLVGRHVSEFETEGWIRPAIAPQVIATRQRISAVQRTHKGKTILVTGIPLFDQSGAVRKVIINSRDMTELIKLQDDLVAARNDIERIESEIDHLRTATRSVNGVVAVSRAMRGIVDLATRVAKVEATVLITGESGVGKEVIARLIHDESPRARGPFIKINCGAIPRELLESELFGHEAGSFTGALRKGKPGLIELAHRGTLLLDEIGEMPLELQVKLLHVIQDRALTRVGATQPIAIDIRILAATNRDLQAMVDARTFRADLFYRLNVVPLEIPPLRARRDDITPLIEHTLRALNESYGSDKRLDPRALSALQRYDWPGNVREVRNIVERLVVMSPGRRIGLSDLPIHVAAGIGAPADDVDFRRQVERFERALLVDAVERCGTTRAAARYLGISQPTLVRKLGRPSATARLNASSGPPDRP